MVIIKTMISRLSTRSKPDTAVGKKEQQKYLLLLEENVWVSGMGHFCPSCHLANGVKEQNETNWTEPNQWPGLIRSLSTPRRLLPDRSALKSSSHDSPGSSHLPHL